MKRIVLGALFGLCLFFSSLSYAETGVRFSPIGVLVGLVDVSLDVGISDNFILSPSVQYWNTTIDDLETGVVGYGVSATYHFSGAFSDSWYLGPTFRSMSIDVENSLEIASADVTFIGGLLGYMWSWSSFYMNLGVVAGSLSDDSIVVRSKTTGLQTDTQSIPSSLSVGIDFKIGWYF